MGDRVVGNGVLMQENAILKHIKSPQNDLQINELYFLLFYSLFSAQTLYIHIS